MSGKKYKGILSKIKASYCNWGIRRRDKHGKKALANLGKTTGKKK